MGNPNIWEDDRTGKEVGDFDYESDQEPALENQPYWVRIGDMEGWMTPRGDGSFEFDPIDPEDELQTLGADYGPKDAASTPDEIPIQVFNPVGDIDENGNERDYTEDDGDADDWWEGAVYRPRWS